MTRYRRMRLVRQVMTTALRPKALILMYHRVAEERDDRLNLAVTPAHFAEQMEVLQRIARPAPLTEVADSRGSAATRAVAVTFDDGYVDNVTAARPVLHRFGVPATFFIASGYVGASANFWWDDPCAAKLPVSADAVAGLGSDPLIDVGAHTVTHPRLAGRPPAEQESEIRASRLHLQELTGASVTSFAYPFGGPGDYTSETIGLVQRAGFACACTSVAGAVRAGTDVFQLPRMHVLDWNGDEFARRLRWWFASQW